MEGYSPVSVQTAWSSIQELAIAVHNLEVYGKITRRRIGHGHHNLLPKVAFQILATMSRRSARHISRILALHSTAMIQWATQSPIWRGPPPHAVVSMVLAALPREAIACGRHLETSKGTTMPTHGEPCRHGQEVYLNRPDQVQATQGQTKEAISGPRSASQSYRLSFCIVLLRLQHKLAPLLFQRHLQEPAALQQQRIELAW